MRHDEEVAIAQYMNSAEKQKLVVERAKAKVQSFLHPFTTQHEESPHVPLKNGKKPLSLQEMAKKMGIKW